MPFATGLAVGAGLDFVAGFLVGMKIPLLWMGICMASYASSGLRGSFFRRMLTSS
jgi:hypothetical protein